MGDRGHIAGRGRHAIPVPPAPSHLLWTAALSARPQSLSLVAVNVRVGPGPPDTIIISLVRYLELFTDSSLYF